MAKKSNVKIWEKWGDVLTSNTLPSSGQDINTRLRIDLIPPSAYPYCINRPTYGQEVLQNMKRVKGYFLKYFDKRLECIALRQKEATIFETMSLQYERIMITQYKQMIENLKLTD